MWEIRRKTGIFSKYALLRRGFCRGGNLLISVIMFFVKNHGSGAQ